MCRKKLKFDKWKEENEKIQNQYFLVENLMIKSFFLNRREIS